MKHVKETQSSEPDHERFQEAEQRYRKLWENVKPYVKRRKFKRHSTKGEWRTSAHES